MTTPSKKMSRARTARRKAANMKMRVSARAICPQCKSSKLPHVACPVCGTYKGKQVIKIKSKKEKKKEEEK